VISSAVRTSGHLKRRFGVKKRLGSLFLLAQCDHDSVRRRAWVPPYGVACTHDQGADEAFSVRLLKHEFLSEADVP
jgi:hypothetical protein